MSKGLVQILKKSSTLMIARIIGGGMAFAVNIMIARWFGADALGEFALCMAVASLIAVLLPAGMQAVAVMFVSQYKAKKQFGLIRGYVRAGYSHIAAMSLIGGGLLAIAVVGLSDHLHTRITLISTFAFLIAPALALINFNCGALTGLKQQQLGLLPDLLVKPGLMFVAIAALGLIAGGATMPVIMITICACMWLTALGQLLLMLRYVRLTDAAVDDSGKPAWRKVSLPWIAITLMWDYFIELHLILAGLLMAPGQIGLLHICFRLRVLAAFGIRALYSLVMPDIYAAEAKGDQAGLERAIAKANFLAVGYSLGVCGALLVLGELILALVNESFRTGYLMLLLICASMIPRAVFGPTTAVMSMKGLQVPVVWILAAGIILSLLLCLALFPIYGVSAIAIAYLVSTTFITGVQWWWSRYKTGIDCAIFAPASWLFVRRQLATSFARA